jgi:hypothetical protein
MGSWTNPNVQQVTPLTQSGSLTGTPARTIVAGTPYTALNLVDVSLFSSYDLNLLMTALNPGAVNSALCAQIQLQWFDDLISGIPVFEEDWWVWVASATGLPSAGTNPLAGSGPMHGRYLTVNISIPITATSNSVLQFLNIFGSNRTVPYSDWRQDTQFVFPGTSGFTTMAGGAAFDNLLAQSVTTTSLAAGTSYILPCGLYSGPIYFWFQFSNTPAQNIVLADVQGLVSGQVVGGTACPGTIFSNPGTAATPVSGTLLLPRAPCAWVIHANATTGGTLELMTIAQQAA